MSPIDPRVLGSPGLPPGADVLRRLAELEARCAKIERGVVGGLTFGESTGSPLATLTPPGMTAGPFAIRTVAVPDYARAIVYFGHLEAKGTGAASTNIDAMLVASNLSGVFGAGGAPQAAKLFNGWTPGLSQSRAGPQDPRTSAVANQFGAQMAVACIKDDPLGADDWTGARQFGMNVFANTGSGNVNVYAARLWVGWI